MSAQPRAAVSALGWGTAAPPGPVVGGPRDRPAAGALPTNIDRFRELVWQPLAAADASRRRWLAALAAFELLRHGAAEPGGVVRANGRRIAAMLGVAETTWCRSTREGQTGYAPLLAAAGLLARGLRLSEDWDRYRLPAWEALQHRAPDATLQGRFVYTHRPAFRATVVRWRLTGVSLAALGAWSLLRYCHARWDTAELGLCDAAIARVLGVKAHTWHGWAGELAGCGALQRLRPARGSGWRLPCYFVLRTGCGLDEALTQPAPGDARNGQVHARAAVQLHATSADPHATPAAGLCYSRAREDPVEDGGEKEPPDGDVERTLERLAAVAGDAWQQQQVRASTTLRARCAALLERTGWSPQRLAAELTARELRSAREPVRVLAHRARSLLNATPAAEPRAPTPARRTDAPLAHEAHDHRGQATSALCDSATAPLGELDALDLQTRQELLAVARARLRRIGLPRGGRDFPDHHPLLRGEALNLLHGTATQATDMLDASTTAGAESRLASTEPAAPDAGVTPQPPASDPAVAEPRPGDACPPKPVADAAQVASTSRALPDAQPSDAHDAAQTARSLSRACRHGGCRRARRSRTHRPARQTRQRSLRRSRPAGRWTVSGRRGASRVAARPRSRGPPAPPSVLPPPTWGASQTRGRRDAG
jgi:hypothetical protein